MPGLLLKSYMCSGDESIVKLWLFVEVCNGLFAFLGLISVDL